MAVPKPYTCIHCGEPCGVTGHLKRIKIDLLGHLNEFCPSVGAVRITLGGEVRYGFACPPGHTCLTASPEVLAFGRPIMSMAGARRNWRDDRPSLKQLDYLLALGYDGPTPVTKGQAHDLLDRIKKNEPLVLDELRHRAIRIRE